MEAEDPDAGHPPTKSVKITFKKKILSNAYETIVANGNHNYMLDPNKQGLSRTKTFANVSLIKRFTYTALNRSVLLPLTAADSQPIQ